MEQEARGALISALNKLYSSDPKEVIACVETVRTIMCNNQAIWEDMIVGNTKPDEEEEYTTFSSSIWRQVTKKDSISFLTDSTRANQAHMIDSLGDMVDALSEWEQSFIVSIAEKLYKNYRLTDKQIDKLTTIHRDTLEKTSDHTV